MPVVAVAWAVAAAATVVPALSAPLALCAWAVAIVALVPLLLRPRATVLVIVLAAAAAGVVASHVSLAQPARTALVDPRGGAEVAPSRSRRASWARSSAARPPVSSPSTPSLRWWRRDARERAVQLPVSMRVMPDDVDRLDLLDVGSVVARAGHGTRDRPGGALGGDRHRVRRARCARAAVRAGSLGGRAAATDSWPRPTGLPDPGGGLVPGLAVGDTSRVDAELDAAMKASSLSHLTAVSGANCALVVGLAFAGAAVLGARRGVRVAAGVAALIGFVVLVTPEPSVSRAAAMAGVAMLAVALGRPAVGIAVLCLAVTLLVAFDPWLATSLGFALSTVATASLLLAGATSRRGPRALDAARARAGTVGAARSAARVRPAPRAHRADGAALRRRRESPRSPRRAARDGAWGSPPASRCPSRSSSRGSPRWRGCRPPGSPAPPPPSPISPAGRCHGSRDGGDSRPSRSSASRWASFWA